MSYENAKLKMHVTRFIFKVFIEKMLMQTRQALFLSAIIHSEATLYCVIVYKLLD